ncbi:MAG: DUF4179 domain-containing protein [Armatimonadota bacterium]
MRASRWLKFAIAAAIMVLLFEGVAVMTPATAAPKPGHGHDSATDAHAQATPEQRAAAARLFEDVKAGIARFADIRLAEAAGYEQSAPFRFGDWGPAHLRHRANRRDDRILDPARPEGLVYFRTQDGRTVLLGAFFVAPRGQGPRPGGPITEWHFHNPEGRGETMHVWTFGHPDGPFARLLGRDGIQAAMQYAARHQ